MCSLPSVSMELVHLVGQYALSQGLDARRLMAREGIAMTGPIEARVPPSRFVAACDALAEASGDPCFGLRLGSAASENLGGHLLIAVMRNSPTVGDAIGRFFRYHRLLADLLAPELQTSPRLARLLVRSQLSAPLGRHYFEAVLAMLVALIRQLPGEPVGPRRVELPHAPPGSWLPYRQAFGCPVRFGATEAALEFATQDLDRPVFLANPALIPDLEQLLHRMLGSLASQESWSGRTRGVLARRLASGGIPALAPTARDMGLSVRTLQSRLKREGNSFQRVLDGLRQESAERMLRSGGPSLCELAFLLGFSEQSAFQRAFKRWTRTTPGRFARAAGESGEADQGESFHP